MKSKIEQALSNAAAKATAERIAKEQESKRISARNEQHRQPMYARQALANSIFAEIIRPVMLEFVREWKARGEGAFLEIDRVSSGSHGASRIDAEIHRKTYGHNALVSHLVFVADVYMPLDSTKLYRDYIEIRSNIYTGRARADNSLIYAEFAENIIQEQCTRSVVESILFRHIEILYAQ